MFPLNRNCIPIIILLFTPVYSANTPKQTTANVETLQLVQIITRHGARAPIKPFPNDMYRNQSLYWPEGWTQLTKEGFQQQIELGQYLRKRYAGFLPLKYSRYDFHCESSDVDRVIQSAEGCMAGLYKIQNVTTCAGYPWQPIPIHTIPTDRDKWLNNETPCPIYSKMLDELYNTDPDILQFDLDNADFIKEMLEKAGSDGPINFRGLTQLQDAFKAEKFHNMPLPDWVTDSLLIKLDSIKALSFEWRVKTEEMKKLMVGPMMKKLIDNFKIKAATPKGLEPGESPFQDQEPFRKMRIFSAHDTTIAFVLIAWGIFNRQVPPYASALMIELHRISSSPESYIEVYFRNVTTKTAFQLVIPDCGVPCYLSKLEEISNKFYAENWEKDCQLQLLQAISPTIVSTDMLGFSSFEFITVLLGTVAALVAIAIWKFRAVLTKPLNSVFVNRYRTFSN